MRLSWWDCGIKMTDYLSYLGSFRIQSILHWSRLNCFQCSLEDSMELHKETRFQKLFLFYKFILIVLEGLSKYSILNFTLSLPFKWYNSYEKNCPLFSHDRRSMKSNVSLSGCPSDSKFLLINIKNLYLSRSQIQNFSNVLFWQLDPRFSFTNTTSNVCLSKL